MVKKMSHREFVRALKAQKLKITVFGTYWNSLFRVAVKCDVCGWEWAPIGGSLLRGHGCPKCGGTMQKSHAEFVEDLKSKRDDVIIVGPYVKALEKKCIQISEMWARMRYHSCAYPQRPGMSVMWTFPPGSLSALDNRNIFETSA